MASPLSSLVHPYIYAHALVHFFLGIDLKHKRMSVASSIFYNKPTNIFTFSPELNKPKRPIILPTSNLVLFGEFVSRKSLSWSPNNTMTESIEVGAFRGRSTGDEGLRAFEQESFVNGSSEFTTNITSDGLHSTLNNLSKWLVAAFFATVILWRHDAEALWAAMGSVLNVVLSTILKQILNQERPVSTLRSDPGMPSSHAQSIFYIVTFIVLSMLVWSGVNVLTTTLSGLLLALGLYFSWLRVSQRLHTISQVTVGVVLGTIFAFIWFWLWKAIVMNAFISYLWVRMVVVLGAAGFCLGFLIHVIRYWIINQESML